MRTNVFEILGQHQASASFATNTFECDCGKSFRNANCHRLHVAQVIEDASDPPRQTACWYTDILANYDDGNADESAA